MKIICLITSFLFAQLLNAQTTYTWNVANGNFLTPSSWTPARTAPAENDVLVFDGNVQASPIVNSVSTQTIGSLRLINGTNVSFTSAIIDTLIGIVKPISNNNKIYIEGYNTKFKTQLRINDLLVDSSKILFDDVRLIYNDSELLVSNYSFSSINPPKYILPKLIIKNKSFNTPSFEISNNCQLNINCFNSSLLIFIDTGAFANIHGSIIINGIDNSNVNISRLIGIDSNSIRTKSTGQITINEFANNFSFGKWGNRNIASFDSGAVFYCNKFSNIFGAVINPRVTFYSGSNCIVEEGFVTIGYKYGNVQIKKITTHLMWAPLNFLEYDKTIFENLQIDTGTLYVWSLILAIKGNLIINPTASLFFYNSWGNQEKLTSINFNGNKPQSISGGGTINVFSTNNSPVNFNFSNTSGITLNRNLNLANSNVMLDTGFINLNGFNLNIGEDSLNYGNLKVNKGFITGNGTLTKWYPANKTVTNNLDSTLFPFGTTSQNRSLWVSGNFTQAGTLTVSYNNNAGFTTFSTPFNDSLTNNLLVNGRQNYSWQLTKSNSLKGTNLAIKALGNLENTYVNLPTNARLTLANSKAPGAFLSGTNTALLPLATRINISDSNLNNTFYLGGYNNYCIPPPTPLANNALICNGKNTQLRAFGIGKIAWYSDSVAGILLKTDSVFNTPFLNNNTNYYVQDSTCMTSARRKITVTVLAKPIVSIIANATMVCKGNSIILRGNGAQNYLWNNGVLNGIAFTPSNSNSYKVIGADSNNCIDSAFINIIVHPNPTVTAMASINPICAKTPVTLTGSGAKFYFWSDGITNGTPFVPLANKAYSLTALDSNGCSNTTFINLVVKPLPSNLVTKNKTVLTASLTGASYQWINCANKAIIVGANSQSFTASINGNYAAIISQNGCSDTSVCINVNSVGINENDFKPFSIYPNPATNKLNIVFEGNMSKNPTANIYDSKGSLVKTETLINNEIDIDNLAQGLYLLTLENEGKRYCSKFVKE